MARPSNYPDSRLAKLRQYLGLQQEHLALFLGISRSLLANIEANRRSLSRAVYERAAPLLALLPDTPSLAALAPPALPLPAAPAPGPLKARRDYCQWRARNLRHELRPLCQRAAVGLRWQTALPALLAALPPPAPAPDPAPPGDWSRFTYPRELVQLWATSFGPDDAARYHLLRLQAEALETEAAALARLLAADNSGLPA